MNKERWLRSLRSGQAGLLLPFRFLPPRFAKPAGRSRARQPAVRPEPRLAGRGGGHPALPCHVVLGCCSAVAEPEPAPPCGPGPLGSCCWHCGVP